MEYSEKLWVGGGCHVAHALEPTRAPFNPKVAVNEGMKPPPFHNSPNTPPSNHTPLTPFPRRKDPFHRRLTEAKA